jgi:hypothetical protein
MHTFLSQHTAETIQYHSATATITASKSSSNGDLGEAGQVDRRH